MFVVHKRLHAWLGAPTSLASLATSPSFSEQRRIYHHRGYQVGGYRRFLLLRSYCGLPPRPAAHDHDHKRSSFSFDAPVAGYHIQHFPTDLDRSMGSTTAPRPRCLITGSRRLSQLQPPRCDARRSHPPSVVLFGPRSSNIHANAAHPIRAIPKHRIRIVAGLPDAIHRPTDSPRLIDLPPTITHRERACGGARSTRRIGGRGLFG